MENFIVFHPPRRQGLVFQIVMISFLLPVGAWSTWQMTRAEVGPGSLLYLVISLGTLLGVTTLVYRAYALWRASFILDRDAVYLRWGLRLEDIPMNSILWVKPAQEVDLPTPAPMLRWPGAVIGNRRTSDGTQVEYLAADLHHLILIGTSNRIFAISPENPEEFLNGYRRLAEMGSFSSLEQRSLYPAFLLNLVWDDRPARYLLVGGAAFTLALLTLVAFTIPTSPTISLGFGPNGLPRDPVPSVQLMLLPVLNVSFVMAGGILGLFFYRVEENRYLAYILWGSGALASALFLIAVLFILAGQ